MALDPKPGLVIRYDFLWKEEERAGRNQGMKDRPCAIILATKPKEDGSREVVLCPITHSPPQGKESGVEIPAKVARHLGLDDARSWIKTHQVNTVTWEADRLPYGVTPAHPGAWSFGQLPQALGRQAFNQVRERSQEQSLAQVRRRDARIDRLKQRAKASRTKGRGHSRGDDREPER